MNLAKPYLVLIADDHVVVRRGVRALLESQPGIEICCEASNGLEALHYIQREKPDLLVLDLTMPEMNGLEVVRSVREESPSTDILVLTMHFSEELARECLGFGSLAFLNPTRIMSCSPPSITSASASPTSPAGSP